MLLQFLLSIPQILKTGFLITRIRRFQISVPDADTVLILGDSTGYGTGASSGAKSIAGLINRDFPNYSIVNHSKNMQTISQLTKSATTISGAYKLILLQVGGVDILRKHAPHLVEEKLRALVMTLSQKAEHILLMTSCNMGNLPKLSAAESTTYEQISRSYRDMCTQVANETPLTYIDLFEDPKSDISRKYPYQYLACDYIHPNDAGYELWYQKLKPPLQTILTN